MTSRFAAAVQLAIGNVVTSDRDRLALATVGRAALIVLSAVAAAACVMFVNAELAVLAVAVSALMAVALFQPLRGHVQSVIDRRFDRSRYDGERITSGFADRLRDEVDLGAVTADLDGTVRQAVAPPHVVVWIRRGTRP